MIYEAYYNNKLITTISDMPDSLRDALINSGYEFREVQVIRLISREKEITEVLGWDNRELPELLRSGYILHPTPEQSDDPDYWIRAKRIERRV